MRLYRLIPWCRKARLQRRRLVAGRAWQQHERAQAAAVELLLVQAAAMPAESPGRVYFSATRDQDSPLLTPGQATRGHGGRPFALERTEQEPRDAYRRRLASVGWPADMADPSPRGGVVICAPAGEYGWLSGAC